MNEIVFEVTQEADGGFCAECLTEGIFAQGDTWAELRTNVKEAVEAYYFDLQKPQSVRLHLVRGAFGHGVGVTGIRASIARSLRPSGFTSRDLK